MRRLFLAITMFACNVAQAQDAIVAQSDNLAMSAADAKRLVDAATPDLQAQLKNQPSLLDKLVRGQLLQMRLLEEARAQQWDRRPEVTFRAQQAYDAVIANSYLASLAPVPPDYPSDAEVQTAYDASKARLMLPRQYHLAQIFVAFPAGAKSTGHDEPDKKLAEIRQLLAKPHADFASVARSRSDEAQSASKGGDLGWIRDDQLIAPLREAVAGMTEGTVSDPIRAPDGWHVVKLLETKPAAPAPLADVRSQLVQALRERRLAQAEQSVIDDILRKHPIRVDEIGLQRATQK